MVCREELWSSLTLPPGLRPTKADAALLKWERSNIDVHFTNNDFNSIHTYSVFFTHNIQSIFKENRQIILNLALPRSVWEPESFPLGSSTTTCQRQNIQLHLIHLLIQKHSSEWKKVSVKLSYWSNADIPRELTLHFHPEILAGMTAPETLGFCTREQRISLGGFQNMHYCSNYWWVVIKNVKSLTCNRVAFILQCFKM